MYGQMVSDRTHKYAATGSSPAGSRVPPHFSLQTEEQTLSAALGYLSSSYTSLLFVIIDGLFLCYYLFFFKAIERKKFLQVTLMLSSHNDMAEAKDKRGGSSSYLRYLKLSGFESLLNALSSQKTFPLTNSVWYVARCGILLNYCGWRSPKQSGSLPVWLGKTT